MIAGGMWSRQLADTVGVAVPLHACEHMYIVTGKIAGVTPDLPCLRDPDGYIYFKEEVGGLLMGGFEPKAKPWADRHSRTISSSACCPTTGTSSRS